MTARARRVLVAACGALALGLPTTAATAPPPDTPSATRPVEDLDRGLVAVPTPDGVLVSWRMLASDAPDVAFELRRDGRRLAGPVGDRTTVLDPDGSPGSRYTLRTVARGERAARTTAWDTPYLDVPLDKPAGGTNPDGTAYTYRANDASVGDLDGDGRYEIVLKWDPTNSQDNSRDGHTGPVLVDAYTLEGRRLWRIDLGRNVRAGAHYTQFLVYDLDGNGRAEVTLRTADGTTDGRGRVLGDPAADFRNARGRILNGPEFLTVFDGRTGAQRSTVPYSPQRGNGTDDPTPAQLRAIWGDDYGNRVDRFLAAVAYLDGEHPSIVMARGYYTRTVLVAYDLGPDGLQERWTFDSAEPGLAAYSGQGNHNLSVADVDGDGRDEIVYGAMAVDDDGTGLYTTGYGHGDAMHVSDLDPARPGLEVFEVHEDRAAPYGLEMHDAATGALLWGVPTGRDTGRGLSADIDPAHPGNEAWAVDGAFNSPTGFLRTAGGQDLGRVIPPANFAVWWDGDLGRELLDHDIREGIDAVGAPYVGKWDPATATTVRLLDPDGVHSNNGTKGNPSLQADLFGDWREEVAFPTADDTALRIFATPYPTEHRFVTLMQDPVYRLGVAWQNVAYNQPPHPGFFLGSD